MPMLNVLQVCSDTNIGGAGKCILTYLKHCDKKSFNVAVVLPANSLLKPKVEALGFKVIEVSAMADKSLDLSAIKKYRLNLLSAPGLPGRVAPQTAALYIKKYLLVYHLKSFSDH